MHIHILGICGTFMGGIAAIAKEAGHRVTGCDANVYPPMSDQLRALGIDLVEGYDADQMAIRPDIWLVGNVVTRGNPLMEAILDAGERYQSGPQWLAEQVLASRWVLAVAGTHGKTTTSSMIAHVLRACGREPGFLIGGELRSAGTNAAWGDGGWTVLEADESDCSFLALARDVAVVTNVELDHHATYGSLADLQATFAQFTAPAELCVAWVEAGVGTGEPPTPRLETYGIDAGDLRAEGVELRPMGSRFTVEGVAVELNVPGEHNVLNALAALAACRAAGVPIAEAAPAIASFGGTGRRFEDRGTTETGARVYDDYAHHPTEVRATLSAARTLDARRIVACFQPHLFSRTRELAREFGRALTIADVVVVVDVYPSRERAEDFPGVSGLLVAEAAADAAPGRTVVWAPSFDDAERRLAAELRPGDVLLTLGAGNVDELATRLTGTAA
jgi:UDP-N-acetylmuramate--alanine ligase